jgi:general secretion pathway protein A
MYQEHYGLRLLPFENNPDPRFLYASEDHKEALAGIEYTIRMRKGIVLVTGEIGSGKTIITQVLRQRLGDSAFTVIVRQGHTSPGQFVRHVCRAMGINVRPNADRGEMLDRIEAKLLEYHSRSKPVVLVVDETQMMSAAVLHEIRMLSNIETATDKLIQIILLGQPDLRAILMDSDMDPLRQRVALSHHLHGMSVEDTSKYLAHRMQVAASPGEPHCRFDDDAVRAIHHFTSGVPRTINFVSDNCLLVGYVQGKHEIDLDIVRHVTQHMMLHSHGAVGAVAGQATEVRRAA